MTSNLANDDLSEMTSPSIDCAHYSLPGQPTATNNSAIQEPA